MPDFHLSSKSEMGGSYSVGFNCNTTLEQVKAYTAKVKEAGFNVGSTKTGSNPYSFTAKNAAGWSVKITWQPNVSSILIGKP